MAKTRKALRWDDLDLGGIVRLTTEHGEAYEGEYLGLAWFGEIYAELRIAGAIQKVPMSTIVRKQLLKLAPEHRDSVLDIVRDWLGF